MLIALVIFAVVFITFLLFVILYIYPVSATLFIYNFVVLYFMKWHAHEILMGNWGGGSISYWGC